MNDKVLIKLIVPEIDFDFDLYIPINEVIWKVKKLIIKSIEDMLGIYMIKEGNDIIMLNMNTSEIYSNNMIVRNTNIRNSTEIIAIIR